jgi:preprotein translocase subunit SecA
MRLFGGENLKSWMAKAGMRAGEPIMHPWINSSIERAQGKVEDRNFEIRKHLLEFDDVLNEQRNFIYERRAEILEDENLRERVYTTVEEIVDEFFQEYRGSRERDFGSILNYLSEEFFYSPNLSQQDLEQMDLQGLQSFVLGELGKDLEEKEKNLGKPTFNAFIQFEYLRNIDSRWQDHLENLEALREAVYLRTYAQKNPLLEYKLEGFQIFDQMLQDIRFTIARKILKVQITSFEGRGFILERENIGDATHRVLGQFAASGQAQGSEGGRGPIQAQRPEAAPVAAQVKRSTAKVGRNDPCPCGSGKKYKYCHGA